MYGIVAISQNGVIGRNGSLPWNIPEDLRHFRNLTVGNIVIMGRKTFDSLPVSKSGAALGLPGRINIVLTRQWRLCEKQENNDDVCRDDNDSCKYVCRGENLFFTNLEYLPKLLKKINNHEMDVKKNEMDVKKCFVIGGSSIFDALIHQIDVFYVTLIYKDVLGDVFFEPSEYFDEIEKMSGFFSTSENCNVEFLSLMRREATLRAPRLQNK
jgi:dihydrofolate reductase